MRRTRRRALPRHIVTPARGAGLRASRSASLSTVVLWVVGQPALGRRSRCSANAFYVFGYTMLLKRRTTQNIVWGGIAGCFPALIGWTAVTGELSWVPIVLFAVVFFWTPPHTWALALRYREDYANVDVPMLPVVAPAREVGRQIVRLQLGDGRDLACCCGRSPTPGRSTRSPRRARRGLPGRGAPDVGAGPAAPRTSRVIQPMRLFHSSNLYLSLLFVAVALDPLLSRPLWRRLPATSSASRRLLEPGGLAGVVADVQKTFSGGLSPGVTTVDADARRS